MHLATQHAHLLNFLFILMQLFRIIFFSLEIRRGHPLMHTGGFRLGCLRGGGLNYPWIRIKYPWIRIKYPWMGFKYPWMGYVYFIWQLDEEGIVRSFEGGGFV